MSFSSLHVDTLTLKVATFEGRAFQELNKIKFGDKGEVPNGWDYYPLKGKWLSLLVSLHTEKIQVEDIVSQEERS